MPPRPRLQKGENLIRLRLRAVNHDRIRPSQPIRLRPPHRLRKTPARDQGFGPRHNHEIGVPLTLLPGANLPAKLLHRRQRLRFSAQKAIRLRENLVLDAHSRDAPLLQFLHEPSEIIKISVPGVAIQ